MHCVFVIDEIARDIFRCLDRHSASVCVRVCKGWSELVLNELWREVDFKVFGGLWAVHAEGLVLSFVVRATLRFYDLS